MSSLEMEVSLWDIANRNGGHYERFESDKYWYEREFRKNADYRSGPVTAINFDYLEE